MSKWRRGLGRHLIEVEDASCGLRHQTISEARVSPFSIAPALQLILEDVVRSFSTRRLNIFDTADDRIGS